MLNEIGKVLRIYWSYRVNMFTEALLFLSVFLALGLMSGDETVERIETPESFFIAYLVWLFVIGAVGTMTYGIRDETVTGTMEQMAMGQLLVSVLIVGRSLARLVVTLVQVAFIGGVVVLLFQFSFRWRLEAIPVFVLTMVGVYGYAYILGGLTIVFKRVESVTGLFVNILLFVNGSFVAIDQLPGWMESAVRLLPTTQGIVVLRRIMLDEATLAQTWRDGALVGLLLHSVVLVAAGLVVFRWCEVRARHLGTLGQY